MSDSGSSPDNPIDPESGWVARQVAEYLATDGRKPRFRYDAPLMLLTTKGRKSGVWRRTCLIYGESDGSYLIVASMGGAPQHPSWYLNLEAHPEVRLQVKEKGFAARARTATPEEKAPLWEQMVRIYPDYADYQEKTNRDIPLVILEPVAG